MSPTLARPEFLRTRSLEQFAASAKQSFPASPTDAPAIRVHRIAFRFLVRPRLRSAIRFADVGANGERLEVVHRGATVIPLVRHHLFDHGDSIIRDRGHRFELLGGLGQRLLNRGGVALVRPLHRDADDRAGLEIDRMLGLVREMRPAVLHLGNLGVGIVRMAPVVIRAFLLPLPIDSRQIGARRRPDAGGLGERRQKLLIALAAVASDDAPQGGVRFQRRGIHADRLAFDQVGRTETLQTPVTSAPYALAICTANVPTPPDAPIINTLCAGCIPPVSRSA